MKYRDQFQRTGRREFLAALAISAAAGAAWAPRLFGAALSRRSREDLLIVEFDGNGTRTGASRVPKIVKTDAEWRKQLSPLAYDVTRHAGTERSFTGAYWDLHQAGIFRCVCCDTALFSSAHKFDSGTGWPSFFKPIAAENVVGPRAQSPGADPTEVTCHRCDAHLGDIYNDGPRPTGLRYCIDSIALRFVKVG
jgi:peptide-methionine (R)-S-oxide reductase